MKINLLETYFDVKLLLTESVSAGEIRKAISGRNIVRFKYDTKGDPNLAPGERTVQIYAYGAIKDKKAGDYRPCIRGFELFGDFSGNKEGGWKNSTVPAWKLFLVNRIKSGSFEFVENPNTGEFETFDEPFSDIYPNIPAFNPHDDKQMDLVWSIIEFPERPKELAYVKGNQRLFNPAKNKVKAKVEPNKAEQDVEQGNSELGKSNAEI